MPGRSGALILTLLTVILSGCAATSAARAVTQPAPVPWIAATPGSLLAPTPTPTVIPAGTRTCRAADLVALYGAGGGATGGQLTAAATFGNRTDTACTLEGTPTIRLFDARGKEINLHITGFTDGPSGAVLLLPNTAQLEFGVPLVGTASLLFQWPTHDGVTGNCVPAPAAGKTISIGLPGGRDVIRLPISDAPNGSAMAPCGGQLSVSPFAAVPDMVTPSPHPWQLLRIALEVPSSVAAGTLLHYTVRLGNDGAEPVRFGADCPPYMQWAANRTTAFAKDAYLLNCRPAPEIPPGKAMSFAMQVAVPASTKPGDYELFWNFIGPGEWGLPGKATVHVSLR
jgi:uncharacterized protein DUF4232